MKDTEFRAPTRETRNLTGLGGWLIIFQVHIFLYAVTAINDVLAQPNVWTLLNFAFTAACIVLFYCRIKLFRIIYIPIGLFIAARRFLMPIDIEMFAPAILSFVLMVGLLFTSRRVKNTFH